MNKVGISLKLVQCIQIPLHLWISRIDPFKMIDQVSNIETKSVRISLFIMFNHV